MGGQRGANALVKRRVGLWTAALLTGAVGVANLLSAVTPSLPERVDWLEQIFPFEIRAGAHLFAVISGFFLLVLAANLLRRKRLAWLFTITMLIVSIFSNLLKGWDYEESLLSALLLGQLLWMRPVFTARSDRPSIIQGIRVLAIALAFTLAYGTLGFFWLDRHYSTSFRLGEAVRQTLAIFFTNDNLGLRSTSRFGRFFIDSIYIIGAVTLLYALWMLLRPVILHTEATPKERQRARKIVERYGCSSLARFALLDDKSYYFSPSGQSVIAYVPKGRGAIALGDPIGAKSDRSEAIAGFKEFCALNDWQPAFYQTLPDDLELYQSLNFKTLKIGEEATVDLKAFTLQGKAGKSLRPVINRFKKLGYEIQFHVPPIADELLLELRAISNEWLEHMAGSEKKFSLGWFDDDYLRDCEIAVVYNQQGNPAAFANIIPEYQRNEITIDLMRHLAEVENGTMDFLFISLFEHFKVEYGSFNLGLVALSGVGEAAQSSPIERGMQYLYEHLNQFYNFQGLRAYKDKFHPQWESRYLVYLQFAALPDVVIGLVRADSGDRLQDYLGTHFLSTAITSLAKRLSRIVPILLSVLLFGLSIWAITSELRKYRLQDVVNSLNAIPNEYLLSAIALTLLNYLLLTGYDTLAVKYINQSLAYKHTALVAIISYAISNSVGFALLSGSAIRYRFYSAWGFSTAKIAGIITFCNLSFWLGLFAVGSIVFTFSPLSIPQQLNLPFLSVRPVGFILLATIIAYLLWTGLSQKPLKIRNWVFPHLPFKLSLAQISLTSADWMLASAVLYVLLLPVPHHFSFFSFFAIYLLGQIVGILSNVPGGLGIFETVLILLLSPSIPSDHLLGALLAYRGIYYFLPLGVSIATLGWYELRQRMTKKT
jgi:phosphatidylglycerol lysyltransferase